MTDFDRQAADFLIKTRSILKIKRIGLKAAPWDNDKELSNAYKCTLKNRMGVYDFVVYTHIVDTKTREHLSAYGVLSCLGYECPDNIDDFASEFGYNLTTSKVSEIIATFERCRAEQATLEAMYTEEELDALREIA